MNYPIVTVDTSTGSELHGLLLEADDSNAIFIHIHGTASNFYIEGFYPELARQLVEGGITYLATNNSGSNALQGWVRGGSAAELFKDCISDIDAWVGYACAHGYSKIFLSGHSLGTEKVTYYMNNGTRRDAVSAVVLMSPSDSYGEESEFLKENEADLFREAEELVAQGKGDEFLHGIWLSHAGVLPKSASSFLDSFSKGSELSAVLPFRESALPLYRNISCPILAIISDNEEDEYTMLPIREALALMEKENPRTETYMVSSSDHCFGGKEAEMAGVVTGFCQKVGHASVSGS